jgi:hypothetical protein
LCCSTDVIYTSFEQSEDPENVVFALVRDTVAALEVPLSPLKNARPNVHVLEADVTDHKALKARTYLSINIRIL